MPELPTTCLRCGSESLRTTTTPSSSGPWGINLLPKLGLMQVGMLNLVVCTDCGKMEIYTDDHSRKMIGSSEKWQDVNKPK